VAGVRACGGEPSGSGGTELVRFKMLHMQAFYNKIHIKNVLHRSSGC
jgi:hypothetical protein